MLRKPKKRLGQHFLISPHFKQKIAQSCDIGKGDTVLEIGPGRGELTVILAEMCASLVAVEFDRELAALLKDKFKDKPSVEIIAGDILRFDPAGYFKNHSGKIKVIGNIPYQITSPIIQHLITQRNCIESIGITIQKELGERLTATPGSKTYGAFSCFVQYYTEAKLLFVIKRGCFYPAPKVDSCFVRLKIRTEPAVKVNDEALFFRIIRAAFNKRRKTLRNSLQEVVGAEIIEKFFGLRHIDRNTRPESLSLEEFAYLSRLCG
ncbi:MAG: 16S rRNA (adenine(1518)-N(6)/adenine(1519)-N(6))-dimethyltransferase RsmA [Candidatus Omnitrophica bacterium]|nr:16S rRNA (adenine(1518)-N(6)/adenine(1519)-N(6))-dimethyltransferase RsmA [Candidatus Omnitrophota bacterium]